MPNDSYLKPTIKSRKPSLTPTEITPEQLGEFLRDHCDVALLGESHTSQKTLDCNAVILHHLKPDVLFIESPPSNQPLMDDPSHRMGLNDYGRSPSVSREAQKTGTPIKCVDVEHCFSERSVLFGTFNERMQKGEAAQFSAAMTLALREAMLRGADFSKMKVEKGSDPDTVVEGFIEACGDSLSPHNRENLRDALKDVKRANSPGLMPKIFNKIDREFMAIRESIAEMKPSKRNPVMAEGIAREMTRLRKADSATLGAFAVGMNHNDEVEDRLEARGFQVANVKTFATRDLKLDRRVFFNPGADSRQGAEWVVTVHEPIKVTSVTFEEQFTIERSSRVPTNLPRLPVDVTKEK